MNKPMWIWYYGDFEIFHNMKNSMRRTQYGCFIPAFWRVSDCNRCVRFRKTVTLDKSDKVSFIADGKISIKIDGESQEKTTIVLKEGTHTIVVNVYNQVGIPALYVSGRDVISDNTWEADNRMTLNGANYRPVGYWNLRDKNILPTNYTLPTKKIFPKTLSKKRNEIVLDFAKEVNVKLVVCAAKKRQFINIYYGESLEEVNSNEFCVLQEKVLVEQADFTSEVRGCRYVRIVGSLLGDVYGLSEYLPKKRIGKFKSNSTSLNKIYNTSKYTYDLTSNLFFVDGIKRDGWIWGGDAYQSMFFDFYYCFDKDIIKRTLIALRGRDPIISHINGIADYTFYWIISASVYYMYTGDSEFIEYIYDDMKKMIEYCDINTDEDGLFIGDESVWTFVDWADVEKDGAVCAIQMLYCKALQEFSKMAEITGHYQDNELYKNKYGNLRKTIDDLYWNEELGGYITSIINNEPIKQIRRHANIFAIIFDFASSYQKEKILNNVIKNEEIPQIVTPFFSFFEYEALCILGQFDLVKKKIEEYWGSMLLEGTGTFWEEYNPNEKGSEKYAMYGRPYEKSLCHAWGASPLYLIGRYFIGVVPTKPGYKEFEICPNLCGLKSFEGKVPVNNGIVEVSLNEDELKIFTDVSGGWVKLNEKRLEIILGKEYKFNIN